MKIECPKCHIHFDENAETLAQEKVRLEKIIIPEIREGDCLDVLKTFPDNHFDSLVTDPPAGIAFMGKEWDEDKGGSKEWIAWLSGVMKEALRVLKPGAHGLVWALPRTSHWTATALEDAGFEIRDVITHLFGSGFPKSLDISKQIDKHFGSEREVISRTGQRCGVFAHSGLGVEQNIENYEAVITAPSTHEAKQWQGWGTSLKPASERWVLVCKPIGTMDSIVVSIKQLEDLWSKLNALNAEKNLKSIQRGSKKAKENTAQENAQIPTEESQVQIMETGVEVDSLEQMDMSQFDKVMTTSLNIVLSWKAILTESLEAMSTSITKTKINPTIDFQTLNFLISEITPENIIQAALNLNGQLSSVHVVNQSLDALRVYLFAIQTPSVLENASLEADSHENYLERLSRIDHVIQTAPFSEDIILIRKPLSEPTVAKNVLRWNTGGINIDASRIGSEVRHNPSASNSDREKWRMNTSETEGRVTQGRFPANLIFSHNEDCVEVGSKEVKSDAHYTHKRNGKVTYSGALKDGEDFGSLSTEIVSAWECTDGCPVAELDRQSGDCKSAGKYKDSTLNKDIGINSMFGIRAMRPIAYAGEIGGASRFFYCAKPSKRERNEGCDGLPEKDGPGSKRSTPAEGRSTALGAPRANHHPTVKSIKLMSYLITMVTPPDGIVLDCFCGSGTTGVASGRLGFKFIGIEKDPDYVQIARHRFVHEMSKSDAELEDLDADEELDDNESSEADE